MGRAVAEALAVDGVDVAIGSRNPRALDQAAAAIHERTGRPVLAVPVDVTKPEQASAFVDCALKEFGRIDILVNNAGGPPFGPFGRFDDAAWQSAFELNLLSTIRMTRFVLPHLPHDGTGRVINVVSLAVRSVLAGSILSTAIRSGVVGMAKMLSEEVGPYGITVNNVAPGIILTDRIRDTIIKERLASGMSEDEALAEIAAAVPLRRLGRPEEFAAVVAFLASERASYVTGVTIPIDGGASRGIS